MPKILILCPTHDHADTLLMSLASARVQTERDWSLVVIGDGAPARTAEVVDAISAQDSRISLVSHPKGERYGEEYRDQVIRDSDAEFVCQLSDDDLWAPNHLTTLLGLIQNADWANVAPMRLSHDGSLEWWLVNHGTTKIRNAVINYKGVSSGPNFVIYRRKAYLDLPEGWTPAPWSAGPSDQFMWAKFMRQRDLRIASSGVVTAIKLPSRIASRRGWRPIDRNAELGPWLAQIGRHGFLDELRRRASISSRIARLLCLHDCDNCSNLEEALDAAGLTFVSADQPFSVAHDGGTMKVPVEPFQQREASLMFSALQTLHDPTKFLAAHDGSRDLALASLGKLGRDRPEAVQSMAEELGFEWRSNTSNSSHPGIQKRYAATVAKAVLGPRLSSGLKQLVAREKGLKRRQ